MDRTLQAEAPRLMPDILQLINELKWCITVDVRGGEVLYPEPVQYPRGARGVYPMGIDKLRNYESWVQIRWNLPLSAMNNKA